MSSNSNAGMEMSAPLVNDIVNSALFYSSPHINCTQNQVMLWTVLNGGE